MNKVLLLLLSAFMFHSCEYKRNNHCKSSTKHSKKIKASELSKIDLRKYYGRSISELLEDVETKPERVSISEEPPNCIAGCTVVYSNDTILVIEFRNVYFQTQCDSNRSWDNKLIKKEFIYRMGLHIKGMPTNIEYFGPKALSKEEYRKRMRESVKGIPKNELPIELVKDLEKE